MLDDYLDKDDIESQGEYTAPEEQHDSLDEDPPVAEDNTDIRAGKFDDEEPNVDDVQDENHPYPHP